MLRKPTLVFIVAMLAIAATAHAHGNLKFVNGLWFDGTRFEAKTMYSVDNVLRTSYDGELAATIDLAGRYVIPPFGDAHNHAFADGANVEEQRLRYLRAGIFYVKNPNNTVRMTAAIRPKVNLPESVDVAYANGGLTTRGGHPIQIYARFPDMDDQAYFVVDSIEELDRKWPKILAGKPDFLKTYLEDTEGTRRGLTPEMLAAIVKRARQAKLRVSTHVTTTADFHHAVAAGVDEINHLPLAAITPADAELAAKRNITVVTTLLSHRPAPGDMTATHKANLELLKAKNVNVVLGVDGGATVLEEADALRKLGVHDGLAVLRMLTGTTPRAIFPGRKFAQLADGYEASFLALDGNPLTDPAALRRVAVRVKQGHRLEIAPEKPAIIEVLVPIVMQQGVDAAIAEYKRLAAEKKNDYDFREQQLNQLGYILLQHGKTSEAIAVFTLNTEVYPKSVNVWDSLGEAYHKAGKFEESIANYRKAVIACSTK